MGFILRAGGDDVHLKSGWLGSCAWLVRPSVVKVLLFESVRMHLGHPVGDATLQAVRFCTEHCEKTGYVQARLCWKVCTMTVAVALVVLVLGNSGVSWRGCFFALHLRD